MAAPDTDMNLDMVVTVMAAVESGSEAILLHLHWPEEAALSIGEALVISRWQEGFMLALPSGFLPHEVLEAGNAHAGDGVVGQNSMVMVASAPGFRRTGSA